MCDCFHLAFPNWHGAPSGTGAGRRLRAPDLGSEDHSACDEPSHFTEGERPRPQGSSPVEEHPETEKYSDSDKEEDDPHHKRGRGKKGKKSGFGCGFDRRSTPKMSKLKEAYSPESGMIVKTAKDGGAEGLVYGGGGKEGIFIKEVVPESPASKSLQLKEGDQLLSATVYFDNVSYQDAIQILEHAQAYKVKLCLKRKPDITETEPLAESDIIPEDETFTPEMREHGKSKRRGDARISWPKFPSLGRGKKSRFARSHSSSEADEQRKLELSPTTSDTESPIKTQDALKGKKRHKMKLPSLTKRGRISSSEDQDTDAPTTCTQEAAELLSPEGLQSPMGRRPEVHRTEEMTLVEVSDSRVTKPLAIQHKVELIAIDSALKTTDLTVALTGEESPTGPLSPDGKKKKKERSELKIKMIGKEKSHKKEAKAKSPKRLKTLGASLEIADQGTVKDDQLEHTTQIEQTSPLKGKGKTKKRILLPKREDIEIPGMEDMSRRTKVKGPHDVLPETVQLSIDVDSVKEAVSKLPGYKLPKVDMCGVPIPEEITVIDANAQRISVKTPTKVADSKAKQEAPISKAEDTSTPELSKTSFNLPKIKHGDLPSEEVLTVTRMDQTAETTQECEPALTSKDSDKKSKTTKIVLPSIGFSKADFRIPDVGMYLPKPNISKPENEEVKGERTIFLKEEISDKGIKLDAKTYEVETAAVTSTGELEYIDSAESPVERELDGKGSPIKTLTFEVSLPKLRSPETDLSLSKTDGKVKSPDAQLGAYKHIPEEKQTGDIAASPIDQGTKERKFKMPQFEFTIPEITGPQLNVNFFKKEVDVKKPEPESEAELPEALDVDLSPGKAQTSTRKAKTPELQPGVKLDGHEGIFQMPKLKVKGPDFDFGLHKEGGDAIVPEAKVDANINIPRKDLVVNISAPSVDTEGSVIDMKTKDAEQDGKGSKFKMPHLSFSMPKVKGHKTDSGLSKKGTGVTTPEPKVDVGMPDIPKMYTSEAKAEVKLPTASSVAVGIKPPECEAEIDGEGIKLKMPKLGVKMPKIGPDIDLTKKDVDVHLQDTRTDGKFPETLKMDVNIGQIDDSQSEIDIKKPHSQIQAFDVDHREKFKHIKAGVDIKCPDVPKVDLGVVSIGIAEAKMEDREIDTEPLYAEIEHKGGKFKMPKLGISMPKVKGPEIDLSTAKKDVNLREAKAEVKISSEEKKELSVEDDIKMPKINISAKDTTSPTKFWRPTFKLPKFGVVSPGLSVEVPDGDKHVKIDGFDDTIPEEVLAVSIKPPHIDTDGPSIEMTMNQAEYEEKESKFKLPTLGFSVPEVKGPSIDFSISKTASEEIPPKVKGEIHLPDVELRETSDTVGIKSPEIDIETNYPEGSPSKFKLPSLKFPKFSLTKQSSKESEVEIVPPDVDISIPQGSLEVIKPKVEFQPAEVDVKMYEQDSKFKMPNFDISMPKVTGPDIDISLSKKEGKIRLPEVELPATKVEIEGPNIEAQTSNFEGSPSKFKLPTVKFPKFSLTKQSSKESEVEIGHPDVNISIPEGQLKGTQPQIEFQTPEVDVKIDDQASKFKVPRFGIAMPKLKGPDIDISLSKKDGEIKIPEAEVQLTDADMKLPSAKVDIEGPKIEAQTSGVEGSPSKFKLPVVKFPKLSLTKQSSKESEVEIDLPAVDVSLPEGKLELTSPKVEFQPPEVDVDIEEHDSKFKMPKFGISLPKMKEPDIDISLSKKDGDIKLPEAEVELTDVEIKLPTAKAEVEGIKIEAQAGSIEGSPSKFKLPTLKLPKLGVALPQVNVEMEKHVKVDKVDVKSPELNVQGKLPESATDFDVKVKKSRFSFPKFSLTKQSSKESEYDIGVPDVDVSILEGNLEVALPQVEFQPPQVDVNLDEQENKFKMPKFGISKPKVKGPEINISLSEKDGELRLPEAEVQLTDIEMKLPSAKAEIEGPKIEVQTSNLEGSPSKFKLPTFSFPKFSITKQSSKESEVETGLPDVDASIPKGNLEVTLPQVDFKSPEVDVGTDGQESKFKMPKFGISMPKVKGPDIDISISKKDGEIRHPESEVQLTSVEMKLPSAKVETEGPKIEAQQGSLEESPSKFKLPTLKLPKLGVALPQASVEVDKDVKVEQTDVKSPDIKLEAELPDTATDVDVKVKKSRFSFPKFSLTKQSSKESEVDIGLPDVDVSVPAGKLEITSPKVEFKPSDIDVNIDGQDSKLKMPKFGISMPKVKGPDIDIGLLRKDGDIKLPEAEVQLTDAELKLPSAKVEIEGPKTEVHPASVEGSPSKFKLPTFKLPKLGMALPQVSAEVDKEIKVVGANIQSPEIKIEAKVHDPATDVDVKMKKSKFSFPKFSLTKQSSKESEDDIGVRDVDVSIPEGNLEVTVPQVEFQPPEIDVNVDGQESKFKLPKFGISMPKVKGPDTTDGEIRLLETQVELPDAEIKLPSAKVDIEAPKIEAQPGSVEGSPSKFKLPTLKLPKLGMALPQVSVDVTDTDKDIKVHGGSIKSPELKVDAKIPDPATDVDVKVKKSRFSFPKFSLTKQSSKDSDVDIDLPDADVSIPEGKIEITSPQVEFQPPEVDVNIDGQETKFKMPKFGISMPKMKGPEIDISLSQKDGEIKLPEAEVEIPHVDVKLPSARVEIEAPKIEAPSGSVEGSSSKFKLPTFKLPKLGVALPQVSVDVTHTDTDIKVHGGGIKSPELKVDAKIPDPATDVDVKVKKSRFAFPKLSLTKQSSKDSDVDIDLPAVDISIPEGKIEITSPQVEFQPPEGDVNIDGQESKFKMPKFGISMPQVKGPDIDISLSKKDGEIKLPEAEVELPDVDVKLPSVKVESEAPKIEVQRGGVEGSPSKFKLPTFSLPKFSLSKESSKEPDVDIGLPGVDVSVPEGKVEITSPQVEFQPPEVDVNIDGQESKFKMPKFGISMPKMKGPDIDISISKKDGDILLPEAKVELTDDVEMKLPSAKIEIPDHEIDVQPGSVEGSPSKFKLPTIKFPKLPFTKQSSKESQVDIGLPNVDVSIPEGQLEIASSKGEFQTPEVDVNIDGEESKFKMPKFGISMPQVKGPDVDVSLSKKDGEITLSEAEVKLTNIEMPSAKMEIEGAKFEAQPSGVEGSPSKFKLPTFKLPKLGVALPQVNVDVPDMGKHIEVDGADIKSPDLNVEAKIPDPATDIDGKVKKSRFSFPKFSLSKQSSKESEVDIGLTDVEVSAPEGKLEITSPKIEFQQPEVGVDIDEHESKFKMPKFGISMPKMKGPEIDISLSKKDGDMTLPEAKVDELSDAEMKIPSAKLEIEPPKIVAGTRSVEESPSKFKLPTFSFPKFSITKDHKESEVDIGLPGVDVSVPEGKMEITSPQVEFQPPEGDLNIDGQESKFKMPKFGISMPKMKGPDIDISISKKDGDIKLPEAEVELPDIDLKLPSVQVDNEAPKIEAPSGSVEGSPSKFKLPTFKLPKLGVALPQVSVDGADTDTDIKVHGGSIKSPELKVDAKIPDPATDVDVKVKKSRFSFPKFSLTKQSSKDSDVDIDLPDADVSIPEGKIQITSPQVEFQPPEVDVNIDGQESKFKMPKFGISMPKMKGPDIDISISKKDGDIKLPEAEVELPDIDVKLPSVQVDTEAPKIEAPPGSVEGSPSKFKLPTFKLPKLGVALPQVSVDVADTDTKVHGGGIKSPELKMDTKIPDPATDVDVKVKKSRFAFPKFSLTKQSSKDSDVDVDLPDVDVSIAEGKIQITSPQVEFQPPEVDVNIDGQESKFKMPKFGISMPKMKGPDIDMSLSKKDGEIKLPEAEVELPDIDVKLPSVQVDTEAPKIEAPSGSVEGSPSKFKLPTFKLPKLGVALPQVSVDGADTDTDIKVHGGSIKSPELKVDAKIPDPATDVDVKVKKSRFSFPKFSLTKQSSKDSDVDIDLPDADVSIPEGKIQITSPQVEFQPPEVDVNIDGQESKFKMPKFGISMPKMKGPDIDISISKKDGDITLPEAEVELPDIDVKLPSVQVDTEAPKIEAPPGSVEGSPSKFKLPTFKLPKLGVALPQVSVDGADTDTDIKVHGGSIKSPELKVDAKIPDPATDVDVKVKKSRFSFPKFSLTKQSSKDSDVDIDLPDADVSIPEGKIQITSPQVEFQPPEVDVNIDGQESKFKMPKFGISMPKMKGPDIDISISKKDGDIKLPEAEVELPDIDVKLPSVQVDTEAPKIEAPPGSVEGSPSKFKLPTFKLPKLGVALPQVSVDVADTDTKVHGGGIKSPELKMDTKIPDPATDVDVKVKKSRFAFPKFSLTKQSSKDSDVDIDLPDVDVSIAEGKIQITSPQVEFQPPEVDVNIDGQESKFKMPKFGISMPKMKGPDIDMSISKKDGEIKLPEAEVELPDIDVKLPSVQVDTEAPKIEAPSGSVEGSPSKFKLPTFKLPKLGVALPQVSVDGADTDTDIKVHGGSIKSPELKVDAKIPDPATDVDVKVKKSRFSFPKFSLTKQSSKDSDVDIDLPDADVSIPEGKIQITSPQVEFQPPEVDVNIDGQESKFKMPKFGISMPKMKGPDIDISISKKDGDIKLPEAEVELPDIDVKLPSVQVDTEAPKIEAPPGSVEGSPSKFKLPTFKLPKLGVALPQVSVDGADTDTDIKVHGGSIKSPELKVDAKIPDPATDVDVKVKKSRFSFPKFSLTKQSSKDSDVDIDLPDADVSIPEGKIQITSPQVEFQPPEVDVNIDGQESKFKMPKFGISMPKMKGPDIDISISKKDGDIKLPEAEVELPDIDVKLPSVQVDAEAPKIEAPPGSVEGSPSKFKLPTFKLPKLGVALPQVSVDVADTDTKVHGGGIKSPQLKMDTKIPDPATDVDVKGKKSRFAFPKFSLTKQRSKDSDVDIDLPDVDVSIAEGKLQITSPQVEFQPPEVDVNIDGQESKFKMPKFGISMPKMKGPDIDMSISKKDGEMKLPEAEVELPDIDVKLPSVQVDTEAPKIEAPSGSVEGSPSKFKLPTFKLPKLGVALPQVSVDVADTDTDMKVHGGGIKSPELKVDAKIPDPATHVDVKVKKSRFAFPKFSLSKQSSKDSDVDIDLPDVDVSLPEGKIEITSPQVEFQPPEVDVNIDGQESKFKMPKFGISMPKMKGPDIDISISKKDGDIKLPEAEVELPDIDVKLPSVQVDTEAPKIEAPPGSVEGSPSKFKLPTFKLPKLGVALPQVSVDVADTDTKVHGGGIKSPELKMDTKIPDPATDVDVKVKKSRFAFPKFSLTKQSSKDSDVDIDLPDVDVSIAEGKIQITSPQVEFQPPEVDVNIDGQESKFKMPKFGISMPKMKGPDIDMSISKKDGEIKLPEAEVELPDIDVKLPSVQVDTEAPKIEAPSGSVEGSPSKFKLPTFKLPKLGVALPQVSVDGADTDTDIKVHGGSIKSPELKVDAKIPDPATDVDVKVKKSRFSFPKFSLTKQSSKDSDVDIDLPDADVSIPEGKIQITSPQVEFQPPEVDVNIDGQESKFKMPKFGISMPKMKGPDIDISISKKDGDIKLPEAEVELPDIDVKLPSVQVDTEAPKIEAPPGSVEGSPSKFKLPTFKLPKLGVALPQVSVDGADTDTDIKVHGGSIKSPELKVDAKIPDPATDVDVKVKKSRFSFPKFSLTKQSSKDSDVDIDLPDADVSIPEGKIQITSPQVEFQPPEVDVNIDGQESKFKMPKFGISMPKMKGPDIDISISKKDGDIKLPEAEVELPDIDVKLPSVQVDAEAPKIEAPPGSVEGSPSKFKLPTFKLPKLGVALPQVSVDVADTDTKVHGGGIKSPQLKMDTKIPDPATDVDVKGKKSRFAFPKFSLTKQRSKDSDVDIDLPDVDVSIAEGKLQITSPQVEFQPPEVDVNIDGQESKFKMPKFGISMPKMKGPDIDMSISKKDGEMKLPEAEVELPDIDVKLPSVQVDTEAPKIEAPSGSVEGSPSKFKLPTFKLPKLGVALPQVSVDVADTDTDMKVHGGGIKSPELKVDAKIPDPATHVDVKVKKSRFAFPKFSLSKQSSKDSDVDIDLPDVDVSLPEGKIEITSPQVEFQPPEHDVNIDEQESNFKIKKLGISIPKVKDIDISLSKKDGDFTLPDADLQIPDSDMKLKSTKGEIEAAKIEVKKSSAEGSPSKFKLPSFKLPKFGGSPSKVRVEVPAMDEDTDIDGKELEMPEDEGKLVVSAPSIGIIGMSLEDTAKGDELEGSGIKMKPIPGVDADIKASDVEVEQLEISVREAPKVEVDVKLRKGTENDDTSPVSPSKFKLPSFKMSKLAFSRQKPEVESVSPDTEYKDNQPEIKTAVNGDGKSPQATPTSFGVVLKNTDTEFDVVKTEKGDAHHKDTTKGEIEWKDKQTKQQATKSPDRAGWFKFPTFGLSSPLEPAKTPPKNDEKDQKSPSGERDENMSPTCSVQSSDIFADISSTVTSEYVSFPSSSPTKITVKYSDQNLPPELGEMNVATSTARSELITIEPNLPEKVTILSSEVSSSEETLRLASEKIHVFTSNVQPGPESHHAKLMSAVQSTGEASQMSSSWTVESAQSSRKTVSQKRIVRETSRESTETFVITQQITKTFDPAEFFADDETASSIQRLRESVHSEKMRFFDGAEK
ncbi:uncharacterized protein LOC144031141 [Festucalex cinctus]